MALKEKEIEEAAQKLLTASKDLKAIDPLTQVYPKITVEEAYRIQLITTEAHMANGHKIVGKKIGLTSPAMQEMFKVDEPDYGHLFDDMLVYQGEGLSMSHFLQPKIEGEIAFVLQDDLKGPGVTCMDVIQATAGVTAALEIIDSRILDWKIKIQDTIADNASSGAFVLGARLVSLTGLDLRYVGFVLTKNGKLVGTGAGAAVLGNPVQSVAWLANKLGEFDISLRAGEIVLSGSALAAVPVTSDDCIHLTVNSIGDVGCFFQ